MKDSADPAAAQPAADPQTAAPQSATATPPLEWKALEGRAIESAAGPLLDQCFEVERLGGTHFLDDFPVWKSGVTGTRLLVAQISGKTVACAGLRAAQLLTPSGQTLPVGVIGAVATDSAFRGKGLASKMVETWVSEGQRAGLSAIFLWGSEVELYQRLGFELCGEQVRVPLSLYKKTVTPELHPGPLLEGYTLGVFQKMLHRREGFALHARDEAWIRCQRSVRWFTLGDPQAPEAYAALGRGIDLQNMVHEWGGDPAAVRALLSRLADVLPDAELLCSPSQMQAWGLGDLALPREFLGLAQILNPTPWIQAFGLPTPPPEMDRLDLSRWILGPTEDGRSTAAYWIWGLDAA